MLFILQAVSVLVIGGKTVMDHIGVCVYYLPAKQILSTHAIFWRGIDSAGLGICKGDGRGFVRKRRVRICDVGSRVLFFGFLVMGFLQRVLVGSFWVILYSSSTYILLFSEVSSVLS